MEMNGCMVSERIVKHLTKFNHFFNVLYTILKNNCLDQQLKYMFMLEIFLIVNLNGFKCKSA